MTRRCRWRASRPDPERSRGVGRCVSRVESVSERHRSLPSRNYGYDVLMSPSPFVPHCADNIRTSPPSSVVFPLSRMDVITSPPLLPPPAFVPHFGDDIRSSYAMTTIRYARPSMAMFRRHPCRRLQVRPQARFKRQSLRSSGGVVQATHDFQGGAAPSMASPISHGHPCPISSAAHQLAVQTWFASVKSVGGSTVSPIGPPSRSGNAPDRW